MSLGRRLLYQILLNLSISLLITVLLAYPFNILVAQKDQTLTVFLYFFSNNFLTIIIFVLLINALYESLFLFQSWQESVLEVEKYKKASLEAEYQNLKGQLNPHFLFNSFNTLAQLVEESPQKAVAFIEGLSDVYRYVLNCRDKEWASLREELRFMEAYLLLLKGRHEAHLQVDFAPEVGQQAGQWYVPPLALQMLIENAIKHNEISSAHPLQIQIRIENESLVVQNNRQQRQVVPSSTKIGLQNIRERYRLMANKSVEVEENEHSFAVSLPLIQLKMG
ncbi:MAG: histidine kinase [Microscillaceae bacterium]|nr:histidine kinase [Microscillaceae bacterium]